MPVPVRTRSELAFAPGQVLGELRACEGPAWISAAQWYCAQSPGDGLEYTFAAGLLLGRQFLTTDMILDGTESAVFMMYLAEGEGGASFCMRFSLLNRCRARVRVPLEATNQNRWKYPREGAWLKPLAGGDRVDLARVDRIQLCVYRKGDQPVRWCMTSLLATAGAPRRIARPLLPCGPLVDQLGQSTQRHWPTRTQCIAELTERVKTQLTRADDAKWPASFARWGGWSKRQFGRTGFFRRHHDGRRWWLVDPDGMPFWSSGVDCIAPEVIAASHSLAGAMRNIRQVPACINFIEQNLSLAFGKGNWRANWDRIAPALLRQMGFNTFGNWSEWRLAKQLGFPYVRPLRCSFPNTALMYRGFPDVFASEFVRDAEAFAEQLVETRDDPGMIGYFLMNEPQWGFASETPASGMLYTCDFSQTRLELARFLRRRYGDGERLARAWQMAVALDDVELGLWRAPLTPAARADLEEFSSIMVARFFGTLSDACRKVDSVHLNLGARYHTVPPAWAIEGMKCFDVFSMNCYRDRIPHDKLQVIATSLSMPTMIGEYHYGALDAGLPASGIMRVANQIDRGRAFRVFVEDAAADLNCVGAHYFMFYDESALGRSDGENYAIGLVDVCNRPYEPLAESARATHERLYRVAAGELTPYDDAPQYLPPVF